MEISLRAVRPADEEFLYRVYASTRADELALVDWDAAQKEAFVRMQFDAQRRSYADQFPNLEHKLILHDREPAGRMMVHRGAADILLVDIALLPEHRNAGIGTQLVRALQSEATRAKMPVRVHVETFNRARGLYERLGFTVTGQAGMYFEMTWRPPQSQ